MQQIPCNMPTPASGQYQSSVFNPSFDEAWRDAKVTAVAAAWSDALLAAFQLRCPATCALKQISLVLTAPTDPSPTRNPANRHEWLASSSVSWSIVVQCLSGEAERPAHEATPGTPEHPLRLHCDEDTAFRGTAEESSVSIDADAAARTARAMAEDKAYEAINDLVRQIRCPFHCPQMAVSISIGPPRDDGGHRVSGIGLHDYRKASAECPWLVVVRCTEGA